MSGLILPTRHGAIRYDVDESGELTPIKDNVFKDFNDEEENNNNNQQALVNLLTTGNKDDDGSNDPSGKKKSWITNLAQSIGSVFTSGALLKTIGYGLITGVMYDMAKNGENSFTSKFINKLGEVVGITITSIIDKFSKIGSNIEDENVVITDSDKSGNLYTKIGRAHV